MRRIVGLFLVAGCAAEAPTAAGPSEAAEAPKAAVATGAAEEAKAAGAPKVAAGPRVAAVAWVELGEGPVAATLAEGPALAVGERRGLPALPAGKPDRLIAAAGAPAIVAAVAGEKGPAAVVWSEAEARRIGAFRPCAIAAAGARTFVAGERPPPDPGEADARDELVLFATGDGDVPAGVAGKPRPGELCALAPAGGGVAVAYVEGDGALVVRTFGPKLQPVARHPIVPAASRPLAPALVADGKGLRIAWAQKDDGVIRTQRLDARGAPQGTPVAATPPHPEGPLGGLALRAVPRGFVLAWHAAKGGARPPRRPRGRAGRAPAAGGGGPPQVLASPLAHVSGPAPLAVSRGVVSTGAVVKDGEATRVQAATAKVP